MPTPKGNFAAQTKYPANASRGIQVQAILVGSNEIGTSLTICQRHLESEDIKFFQWRFSSDSTDVLKDTGVH